MSKKKGDSSINENVIPRKEILRDILGLPDPQQRSILLAELIAQGPEKGISEQEIADFEEEDARIRAHEYEHLFAHDEEVRAIVLRYDGTPILARALVKLRPAHFYNRGFVHRVRMKLNADLGKIKVRDRGAGGGLEELKRRPELPESIQAEMFPFDCEHVFRTVLPTMSKNPDAGIAFLTERIHDEIEGSYNIRVFQWTLEYCRKLLAMEFPAFVTNMKGFRYPAFHVRWWIDKSASSPRHLNMGDTGTYKSSFGIISMVHFGCKKILILCSPNPEAKEHWNTEIVESFKEKRDRCFVIRRGKDIDDAVASDKQFTVIPYSILIRPGVLEKLLTMPFDGLIWDESQYGNHVQRVESKYQVKRADACVQLVKKLSLKRLSALSATPWENHPKELAALASAILPDLFPTVESFRSAQPDDPRFLRELFDTHILEVELREIKEHQEITPKPWENLFGDELIDMEPNHAEVYEFVRAWEPESGLKTDYLHASVKVRQLLEAAVHPHAVEHEYPWTKAQRALFDDSELSTKLRWMKRMIAKKRAEGAKIVVATGIVVDGVTRDEEEVLRFWVGRLFQEWYGEEHVLILDAKVTSKAGRVGSSARHQLITQWRMNPDTWLLLVSKLVCPDTINLSVPAQKGVEKVFITSLSLLWKPWKQFLGRFIRGVITDPPVEYTVPVLRGTIDEALLRLNQKKWDAQLLFRAQVALTREELKLFDPKYNIEQLRDMTLSDAQVITNIGRDIRTRGELGAYEHLQKPFKTSTHLEEFAKSWWNVNDTSRAADIARFMKPAISRLLESRLVDPERIFDAGCGALRLELLLELAVYGMDMNPHMIEIAREKSPHRGKNARVGFLSSMPTEWTKKFDLTVASLVIDWSTSKKVKSEAESDRIRILRELVRVTDPDGYIWLTFTEACMDIEIMQRWREGLEAQGMSVVEPLTGFCRSQDNHGRHPTQFWSLCFSPNGRAWKARSTSPFELLYETIRITEVKRKAGGKKDPKKDPRNEPIIHERFEIEQLSGIVLETNVATTQAIGEEAKRLEQAPGLSPRKRSVLAEITRFASSLWQFATSIFG